MIKITNLNKYYNRNKSNEIHVINNSTIEFPEVGLVTIHGESGCGKTTLLNVLGGLDDFHSGIIEIDDLKIKKYSSRIIDKVRNEKIGYIFQNYLLLQQKSVYENLKIILDMYKLTEQEKNSRIDYVLNAVGMMKYKKRKITELSGGQQQRVGIARALIKSPSLILADEPTGNLDEKNTIEVMNILKKISKTTLVVLVSHEQSIVNSYSDYIIKVKDGKIISQDTVTNASSYKKNDDQNIYLKELEYKKLGDDNISIDFYSDVNIKTNVRIIFKDGRFFISSSENVVLIDDVNEVKIIDDYKKELVACDELETVNYEMSKLQYIKDPKLSLKETFNLAKSNLMKMKNRTLILTIPLFTIIILVLFSIHSLISASKIDVKNIAYFHSGIYNVSVEKADTQMNHYDFKEGFELFCEEFNQYNKNIEMITTEKVKMKYTLKSFSQLKENEYIINGFSLLNLDQLSDKKLYYGRLPETFKEIVVEKWVLEKALEDSTLNNFMTVKSFINQNVNLGSNNFSYKIVGIADNDENAVYVNRWTMFDIIDTWFNIQHISIASLDELKKYVDVSSYELTDGQCLWNTSRPCPAYENKIYINNDNNYVYEVVGQFSFGGAPFDMVVDSKQYDSLFQLILNRDGEKFNVFCANDQEREQVDKFIESISEKYASGTLKTSKGKDIKLLLFANSEYDNLLEPYIIESNKVIKSRLLITFSIIMISIIIVYFTMKSYAMKNIYDIGVYRSIGIKKSSVINIYLIEILLISLKTTLLGGVLCYAVTNIIGSVPVIDENIAISFNLFLACTFGLILINTIVGTLPIIKYLKYTPAKILTKYDA